MSVEQEVVHLRGQVVAMQMVVVGLCLELRKYNDEGEHLVAKAFSYADRAIDIASAANRLESPRHLDAALASLEQLGNAALRRLATPVS